MKYHWFSDFLVTAVPQRSSFRGLELENHGLAQLEQEIFLGFVFVRFEPGLPSVREMAAPYEHELAAYRMEELEATRAEALTLFESRLHPHGARYAPLVRLSLSAP